MAAVPFSEASLRGKALAARRQAKRKMKDAMRAAFGDVAMLDHSALVVWTKGQMRGIRATIKRLGMA